MKTKKGLAWLLCLLLAFSFAACSTPDGGEHDAVTPRLTNTTAPTAPAADSTDGANPTDGIEAPTDTPAAPGEDLSVAVLTGPTAIGMIKLMSDAKAGTTANNYTFTVAGTADEITASLISGAIPIASIPCNLAATLYNKSNGGIKILGINTLGVLYILENGNSIQSVEDLRGKTIYTTGAGTTPEYTLYYLLQSAGLEPGVDVTVEFRSEASEVAALLAASEGETVAMLPQPYVTSVLAQNETVRIALDVTAEWENYAKDSSVVTGVIAVNSAFLAEHEESISAFLSEYAESAAFAVEQVDEAAALLEDFNIFKAAVAKQAIPYCNIVFIDGDEMKEKVGGYLSVLYEQNPNAVGGSLPGDDFYH